MMNFFLKGISYVFHPLLMPLLGVVFYFQISSRFFSPEVKQAKLISLVILTLVLPLLLYFLLKTLKKVKTIHLETTQERILPLVINGLIMLLIISRVLPPSQIIELYYFFVGILISTMACLILAIAKFKASIHMIAVSGVFMFFVALSVHFSVNINSILAIMVVIMGAVATSRLHLKAHTYKELILGVFVGTIPQLILVSYWL